MYALLSSEVYFLAVGVPLKNSAPAVMERLSMAIKSVYKELHADHETGAADNK